VTTIVVDGKRYDTDKLICIWEGRLQTSTGRFRRHIWMTPKSKRVIVHTESVWENPHTHACQGDSYSIADVATIAHLAVDTGDERLMDLVPEGD